MEELARGLNLLAPQLQQMTSKIDQLSSQVVELRGQVEKKAESTEVSTLKEQLQSAKATLAKQRKDHVEKEHFDHLSMSVQELCAIVAQKADCGKVDQLYDQLRTVSDSIHYKVESRQLEELRAQVQASEKVSVSKLAQDLEQKLAQKADISIVDFSEVLGKCNALNKALEKKADISEITGFNKKISGLSESIIKKAEGTDVEKFNDMFRTVNATLSQKTEFTEMQQVKTQLRTLNGTITEKAESHAVDIDQLQAQLREMRTELGNMPGIKDQTNKVKELREQHEQLREHILQLSESLEGIRGGLTQKADNESVGAVVSQLQVLSDILAPKMRTVNPQTPRPQSARRRVQPST